MAVDILLLDAEGQSGPRLTDNQQHGAEAEAWHRFHKKKLAGPTWVARKVGVTPSAVVQWRDKPAYRTAVGVELLTLHLDATEKPPPQTAEDQLPRDGYTPEEQPEYNRLLARVRRTWEAGDRKPFTIPNPEDPDGPPLEFRTARQWTDFLWKHHMVPAGDPEPDSER